MMFFRKKKELKDKLQRIDKEFKNRTADVSDDIWDLGDFLILHIVFTIIDFSSISANCNLLQAMIRRLEYAL